MRGPKYQLCVVVTVVHPDLSPLHVFPYRLHLLFLSLRISRKTRQHSRLINHREHGVIARRSSASSLFSSTSSFLDAATRICIRKFVVERSSVRPLVRWSVGPLLYRFTVLFSSLTSSLTNYSTAGDCVLLSK